MNSTPKKSSVSAIEKKVLDSFLPVTKLHTLLPIQFRLAKLSFVSNAPLFKYHIKILIFKGIFACQIFCVTFIPLLTRFLYIECTVKQPLACRDQMKVSLPSCKLMFNNISTIRSQSCSLSPTKALLKEIFSGVVLNTSATVACRRQTILNRVGNWNFNVLFPSHMSSKTLLSLSPS